jgi:nucleotide-binding universal stress UspA family protein
MTDIEGGGPSAENDESASDESASDESAIILAAVDASTLASRVVDFAARAARRLWSGAQLHLLHVYKSGRFDRPAHAGIKTEDLVAEAQSLLAFHVRMARRQCPAPVTGHFAQGDPADEILRCARSLSPDLLVLGTHDAWGLERFLLGSVAETVAKRAPCSVVVVRQKDRPYKKVP